MTGAKKVSGRCLCGAITFSSEIASEAVGICHCDMCQRWAAGPFLAVEGKPGTLDVQGVENLGVYPSSEWGERCFCKTCGSALMWRSRDGRYIGLSAGTLSDKSQLSLAQQIFIDEKPAYYDFANDTPKLTGPEFLAMISAAQKP